MKLIQRTYITLLVGSVLFFSHSSPVRAELVGYWPMDEGSGETVADHSGNDLTGYFFGDPVPEWFDGRFGGGLSFNLDPPAAGFESAQVRVPDESFVIDQESNDNIEKLRFTTDDSFTAMAWVYIPDEPRVNWQGIVTKGRDTSPTAWWGLWVDSQEHWAYGHNGNHLRGGTLGLDPVEPDSWTHFAIQQNADDQNLSMYLNGEEVGIWNGVEPQDSPGDLIFAAAGGDGGGVGGGCCNGEWFVGGLDEVRVYNTALSIEEIQEAMAGPIDMDPLAPLDNGTLTDPQARADYVHNVLGTWIGDSNLDLEFNSGDLVAVFQAGEYEDGVAGNSSWVTGDWNGDKEFGTGDLVIAFQDGGFEAGPRGGVLAVPEPHTLTLLAIGLLGLMRRRR